MAFARSHIPCLIFVSVCVFAEALKNPSDWDMRTSLDGNWTSGPDQRGWNNKGTCYPTFACFDLNFVPTVDGYRWSYANDLDPSYVAEISLGCSFNRWRRERSASWEKAKID